MLAGVERKSNPGQRSAPAPCTELGTSRQMGQRVDHERWTNSDMGRSDEPREMLDAPMNEIVHTPVTRRA